MIQLENHLGTIEISHHFLVNLITDTAVSCFGVAGMATCNQRQGIKNKVFKTQSPEQGVRVRYLKQRLVVDLHILVIYGMNISAVVKSCLLYTSKDLAYMKTRRIADAHTHIFPEKIAEKATFNIGEFYGIGMNAIGLADKLIESGREIGVTRYLVCSVATKESQVISINDFIHAACQAHPEFLGFASLHPDLSRPEAEIERVYALGMRGIKFHPDFQLCNIDDEKLMPTYRKMAELGLPGLFHMGDDRYDFSAPVRLRRVKDRFPELTCIAAHFGGYQVWDCLLYTSRFSDIV